MSKKPSIQHSVQAGKYIRRTEMRMIIISGLVPVLVGVGVDQVVKRLLEDRYSGMRGD
jgi:hypothetical protein